MHCGTYNVCACVWCMCVCVCVCVCVWYMRAVYVYVCVVRVCVCARYWATHFCLTFYVTLIIMTSMYCPLPPLSPQAVNGMDHIPERSSQSHSSLPVPSAGYDTVGPSFLTKPPARAFGSTGSLPRRRYSEVKGLRVQYLT